MKLPNKAMKKQSPRGSHSNLPTKRFQNVPHEHGNGEFPTHEPSREFPFFPHYLWRRDRPKYHGKDQKKDSERDDYHL